MRCPGVTPQQADDGPADSKGIPEQLEDMRWVYAHPAREDRTQGHKLCRKWMNADLPGFMARKTSLEAKVPLPKTLDDEYPVRLQLDDRRCDPGLDHSEMISLLIFFEDDTALELYLTLEEWTAWREAARDAGLNMKDWLMQVLRWHALRTLTGPPGGVGLQLPAPDGDSPHRDHTNGFTN
jgi:hypothetical protein